MSQVFHGVVACMTDAQAKAFFVAIDSKITLRLVRLDDGIFGIYARRHTDYPGDLNQVSRQLAKISDELQRVAADLSRAANAALLYWYDSRVGDWYQLYEHGQLTRDSDSQSQLRKSWGKADPLELIGARSELHNVIEHAFLYDSVDPLEIRTPQPRGYQRRNQSRHGNA